MAMTYGVKPTRSGVLEIPSFGTQFGIEYVDKSTGGLSKVPITVSPESGLFYALFPEDDVDFRLIINNKTSKIHDFLFAIKLYEQESMVSMPKNEIMQMASVESYGPKLHFIRQGGEEGQSLVAAAASRHGLSFADASVMVSRLEFSDISFGKRISICKCDGNADGTMNEGKMIQVFVKTTRGNTIKLDVKSSEVVERVKELLEDREGIPAADQRLLYMKFLLRDGHRLDCYRVKDGANFIMYGGAMKGGCRSESRESSVGSSIHSVDYDDESDADTDIIDTQTGLNEVGDRGVICCGGRSTDIYGPGGFSNDTSIKVKPFIIEMRMASRFTTF